MSYDPAIPLLGLCPKELKSKIQKGICTPMFTAALIHNNQKGRSNPCPMMNE